MALDDCTAWDWLDRRYQLMLDGMGLEVKRRGAARVRLTLEAMWSFKTEPHGFCWARRKGIAKRRAELMPELGCEMRAKAKQHQPIHPQTVSAHLRLLEGKGLIVRYIYPKAIKIGEKQWIRFFPIMLLGASHESKPKPLTELARLLLEGNTDALIRAGARLAAPPYGMARGYTVWPGLLELRAGAGTFDRS